MIFVCGIFAAVHFQRLATPIFMVEVLKCCEIDLMPSPHKSVSVDLQTVEDAAPASSHVPESQPAALAPFQPAAEPAATSPVVIDEPTPQLTPAPVEAVREVPEAQPAAHLASRSSEEAPSAPTEELSAAPQKQHSEMTQSAEILVDTVTMGAQERRKENGEQSRRPQPELEAAPPAPAVQEQLAKEPAPKQKKSFSFFKRGRCAWKQIIQSRPCPSHLSSYCQHADFPHIALTASSRNIIELDHQL